MSLVNADVNVKIKMLLKTVDVNDLITLDAREIDVGGGTGAVSGVFSSSMSAKKAYYIFFINSSYLSANSRPTGGVQSTEAGTRGFLPSQQYQKAAVSICISKHNNATTSSGCKCASCQRNSNH